MQLNALCALLASSSALHPGARPRLREASCGDSSASPGASPRLCRRQALCGAAAAALSLTHAAPAFADYGQAAAQKLPALVPSPIRPTGEMAKTCEIVALGREVAAARSKVKRLLGRAQMGERAEPASARPRLPGRQCNRPSRFWAPRTSAWSTRRCSRRTRTCSWKRRWRSSRARARR